MRTADADILIVPGWGDSDADHWQSRWERSLSTARRIVQADWHKPDREQWTTRIAADVARSIHPPVLVAHSLGCAAVVHAASKLPQGLVAGALLVAPADVDAADGWPEAAEGARLDTRAAGFAPMPMQPLPFPALVLASSNDQFCSIDRAREFAAAWGAAFTDAGDVGHINTASGHGPWPEGLLRFGSFLKGLG